MKINIKNLCTMLSILVSLCTIAQNRLISGSCVGSTQRTLTLAGDSSLPQYNGRPVYYNAALPINYDGQSLNTMAHLFYATAAELGTAEDRWVVAYDGQPYYYSLTNTAFPPSGTYQPFDTNLSAALCGSTVQISLPCENATAFSVTGGGPYCSNGTGVSIGLSGSQLGFTYTLTDQNGNPVGVLPQAGTGSALSFSGITVAGTYKISALETGSLCDPVVMTGSAVVSVTPVSTDGSVTTSICQGQSYTWPANGQTYTTAQNGITVVNGCNTATLNLTVNPLTSEGTVITSICAGQSYTWPANGQTYTSAQNGIVVVNGCNTATLTLSIIPLTTDGSVTTSICQGQFYTWPVNGETYNTTQSGITVVNGCNTATLNLTVNPSTTAGSEVRTECGDSYTWPVSGETYTSSGTYPYVVGCNTATLTLTLAPITTNGSATVTACGLYTWVENGVTYTTSGVYTHITGCNTATLNLTINTNAQNFYADTDGDNFGAGPAILSCSGQPAGTSTNNTDCAPQDGTKWRLGNFYVDADNDGYNNGLPPTSVCYGAVTPPSGYALANNGLDCNDSNAAISPNASEIVGNGIDDNCDGTIDEVTPTSYLLAQSCNITIGVLQTSLFCDPLINAAAQLGTIQGFRFRVTNGATVRTFDSAVNSFNLTQLPGGAVFGETYTIAVSCKSNGYWRAYGSSCTVTTSTAPRATYISNPNCGSTLINISQTIFCETRPGVSGYRFRVRRGATLVGTVDKTVNRFSLTELGLGNLSFGTTYTIDVLLAFSGVLRPDSEYGPTCSITTPAATATSRVIQPTCGSTITSLWTTIFAQQVTGAQGYKFVVTNGAQTRELATANSRFQLPNLPGGAAANTAYTIRVDVLFNGNYVVGTDLCTITTSPTATRQAAVAIDIYEVSAYPNPYADTFKLNVNTSSEDQVGVKVYDMLGREIESRQASIEAISNLEIGSQYPSGVYNIIVSQGENVKTMRVIKR